jgi:ArsR family transcriptional regulator, cadmium/lead-responsive transcriptional repressor
MTRGAAPAIDDQLWAAIGDPTRRQVLDLLLTDGVHTATALSQRLPVSRQAVAKHLTVLDRAGLVRGISAGREKRYQIDHAQLARAAAQLIEVSAAWDVRARKIKRIAEEIQSARNKQKQPATRVR